MDAKTPTTTPEETPEETPEQRGKLLSELDAKGRDLIERISGAASRANGGGSDRAYPRDGRSVERAGGAGHDVSGEPRDERGRWTSGGSSSDYESAGPPSRPDKAQHLQAVYTLNSKGKEAAKKAGRTPLTFHALTPDGNECLTRLRRRRFA